MKRDMDLVRQILLAVEQSDHGYTQQNPIIDGYSDEQISYHVYLLKKAGLVDAADISSNDSDSPEAIVNSLTWDGHEFLDNSRKPEVWAQAKSVMDKTGGASFEVWKAVLTQVVKNSLGI